MSHKKNILILLPIIAVNNDANSDVNNDVDINSVDNVNGDVNSSFNRKIIASADMFARYNRLIGNNVAFIIGAYHSMSDNQYIMYYNELKQLGVNYDYFARLKDNRERIQRDVFNNMLDNGVIFKHNNYLIFDQTRIHSKLDRWLKKLKLTFNIIPNLKSINLTTGSDFNIGEGFNKFNSSLNIDHIALTADYCTANNVMTSYKDWWCGKDSEIVIFIDNNCLYQHIIDFPALLFASSKRGSIWHMKIKYCLCNNTVNNCINNNTIVDTVSDKIGEILLRSMTFISAKLNGLIMSNIDVTYNEELYKVINEILQKYNELMSKMLFDDVFNLLLKLMDVHDNYLFREQPWLILRENFMKGSNVMYYSINIIATLAIMLYPLLPNLSEKILSIICIDHKHNLIEFKSLIGPCHEIALL